MNLWRLLRITRANRLRPEAHNRSSKGNQEWHVLLASICPATSRHGSRSPISSVSGSPRALKILDKANVDAFKKIQDLGEEEVNRIRQVIEDQGDVEGDLRKDVSMHIKRLIDIQSYRGLRHRKSLPVRGQRTHTNARTRKGPRKGTIAGKKKASAKT